jgi:hypothetical protein
MKHIFKFIPGGLLAIILATGCDTNALHDMNINPNAVNQMDMNYFLTAAELGIASGGSRGDNRYIDWRTNIGMCAHATQQLATATTGLLATGDKYIDNDPEVNNAPFQFWLQDVGRTTAEVIKQAGAGGTQDGKRNNTLQAARVIRAFNFARLTDMYGNVPYTEANQGLSGLFYPKYDKQKDVYLACLQELESAAAAFDASTGDGFATADFIFNGDVTKWKKFAYSVMLRMGMRVSMVDASMATEWVNKALAGGVFQSNDDNVWVKMSTGPSEWVNQNGISRAMAPGDGGQGNSSHIAKTMVDFLMGTDKATTADDDPRLMIYCGGIATWTATAFTPIAGGTDPLNQIGLPNGVDQSMLNATAGHDVNIEGTYTKMNPLLLGDGAPFRIMTYSETELLQAEAKQRSIGSVTGTAQQHYEAGVKAAMQMWVAYDPSLAVSDAQVATYLATYPFGSKDELLMIGEQLWASHFMNWYEAWSEWRRTGLPHLTAVNYPGNDTNGTIPEKLRYPASEVSGNPNFGGTSPDLISTKVWWAGGAE